MPENNKIEQAAIARKFWSGAITFGLVNVPVSIYAANRAKSVSLRMLDQNGVPLKRRYFCPAEDKPIDDEEIVRGYEIEKDKFITVSDDELEAVEPKKSREIDLRRFVKLAEIDPIYFQRAYFLAPSAESTKAYRLLAEIMERSGRAGIATFVMRGREYVVAIISESGILRAETLHFHDEIRTPEDIGLPEISDDSGKETARFKKEIKRLSGRKFDRKQLSDRYAQELSKLVEHKLRKGTDVVAAPSPEKTGDGEAVDIMEVLQKIIKQGVPKAAAADQIPGNGRRPKNGELQDLSKADLYEQAKELDISGRSKMSRKQLIKAIEEAS